MCFQLYFLIDHHCKTLIRNNGRIYLFLPWEVKFPPHEVTFMVSGVFNEVNFDWSGCITSCGLVSARWKFHFPRQKQVDLRPIPNVRIFWYSFRVRQKFCQPLDEMSFWETFLNICYFFKKPNLVHTDQKRILLWKVLFSIMLSLNAFQQIILIKSQTTPNFSC